MKNKYCAALMIFTSIILLTVFVSCKNTSESKLVYTESNTIKKAVKEKEKNITWTQELEAERLSKRITRSSMELGSDVVFSKELFKIQKKGQKLLYPDFTDFGSLDTSNLSSPLKTKLNDFCKSLSSENHAGADSYFSRKYIFNYVFFIKDLEEGWKKNFGKAYSEKDELFTKWIFGQPFIGSEIIQIPVRFYSDHGIIDITVFLNAGTNNEFYQITIDRWKKV